MKIDSQSLDQYISIPYIPFQVAFHDIKEYDNHCARLVPQFLAKEIKDFLVNDIRTNKKSYRNDNLAYLKTYNHLSKKAQSYLDKYNFIKRGNRCFVVYWGDNSLGSGGFGSVKLAQDIENGEWFALKVAFDKYAKPVSSDGVFHDPAWYTTRDLEVKFHKEYSHFENLIWQELKILHQTNNLITATVGQKFEPIAFRQYSQSKFREQFYYLMPLAHGESLFSHLEMGLYAVGYAYFELILKLTHWVEALHAKGILHRDIKIENIHWNLDEVVLLDFGLARQMDANGECKGRPCGSLGSIAPEIFKDEFVTYNSMTDIYALGVVFAQIFRYGVIAKNKNNFIFDERDIVESSEEMPVILDKKIRLETYDFIKKMLGPAEARPTLKQIKDFIHAAMKSLAVEDKLFKVAVLNAAEYLTLSSTCTKDLLSSIAMFDEVWLITDANQNIDLMGYAKILRDIQQNDGYSSQQVFVSTGEGIEALVNLNQKKHPHRHYYVFYNGKPNSVIESGKDIISEMFPHSLTVEAKQAELKLCEMNNISNNNMNHGEYLTEEDYDALQKVIQDETARLTSKYKDDNHIANKRCQRIDEFAKSVANKTYREAAEYLKSLDKKMYSTHFLSRQLEKVGLFSPNVTGRKVLAELREEMLAKAEGSRPRPSPSKK